GAGVLVGQVDVVQVHQGLPLAALHPLVRLDEGARGTGVGLLVPRPRLHLRDARVVVAAQLAHAVVGVAPDAGELAHQVDAHALAAVRDGVEGAVGHGQAPAGVAHVGHGAVDVAGVGLGDLDGCGDLGDGARLLHHGRLGGGAPDRRDAVGAARG